MYGCAQGCLRGLDVAFEEDTDGGLGHGLNTGLFIAVDFVETDVVLRRRACEHMFGEVVIQEVPFHSGQQ